MRLSTLFFRGVTSYLLLCCIHFFTACSDTEPPSLAFYHWQTRFAPDSSILNRADYQQLNRLYVKYFDLSWQAPAGATPQANIQWEAHPPEHTTIIPCVFITNEVFEQTREEISIDSLSANVYRKLRLLHPDAQMEEVQIDCDWTQKTREAYFLFLRKLKKRLNANTQLSVTLRLHQLQYPQQTGVPPVDRAMLMFYNMGEITNWQEPNSILNLETASSYLDAPAYALPLDVALPIFRWGLLFREGKFTRIINMLSAEELADSSRFRRLDDHHYELLQSTYLGAYYCYQGDRIRLEQVQTSDLEAAVALLRDKRPEKWQVLSFYHLDSTLLHDYPPEKLDHFRLSL